MQKDLTDNLQPHLLYKKKSVQLHRIYNLKNYLEATYNHTIGQISGLSFGYKFSNRDWLTIAKNVYQVETMKVAYRRAADTNNVLECIVGPAEHLQVRV